MASTPTVDAVAQALTDATTVAGQAPSIHNTQPWRWRTRGNQLDLFVEDCRTLDITDPDHHPAILSCGAALHHAVVRLTADGWHANVTRLPTVDDPEHLATVLTDIADTHDDRAAVFAILYGPGDDGLDWLRAGEALSAAWLTALEVGISVVPLSVTMEVTSARETISQLLSGLGHPYLVLRFGVFDPDTAGRPAHTPSVRRPGRRAAVTRRGPCPSVECASHETPGIRTRAPWAAAKPSPTPGNQDEQPFREA